MTDERAKALAEVDEEIEVVELMCVTMRVTSTWQRILSRLQGIRAEMCRGMKEGV